MGGNYVTTDGIEADRIDMHKIERDQLTLMLGRFVSEVNKLYNFWAPLAIINREIYSGSGNSLMNYAISDADFKRVKPTVGDFDILVPHERADDLAKFLTKYKGKTIEGFTLKGFKLTSTTSISIWHNEDFNLNIQIDWELADFDEAGRPTEFAKFSRSSSWDDLQLGIKGVFSKYLIRALTSLYLVHGVIPATSSVSKPKVDLHPTVAFSVDRGLRKKYDVGAVDPTHGVPTLIDPANGEYTKNLADIFKVLFNGVKPVSAEIKLMSSFVGLLKLIKRYHKNKNDIKKIGAGFTRLLFGPGAQVLYRNDMERDRAEKLAALQYFNKVLPGAIDPKWLS
jgi:hypothetical protein